MTNLNITYQYLWKFYSDELTAKANEKAHAQLKVIKSYLGLIHKYTGKDWNSDVGPELLSSTEFGNFLVSLKKDFGASTISSVKSKLGKVREAYAQLSMEQNLANNSFAGCLELLVNKSGKTISQVAREIGMPILTLDRWLLGKHLPEARNLPTVANIERYFKLPENSLRKKLGFIVFGERTKLEREKADLSNSNLIRALSKSHYSYLSEDWDDTLKQEFEDMFQYYTDQHLTGVNSGLHRTKKQRWRNKNGKCNSKVQVQKLFENFFGALIGSKDNADSLAVGVGLPADQMHLALITNPKLLEAFFQFQQRRMGTLTTGAEQLIKRAIALLQPTYGYIRQRADLGLHYAILNEDGTLDFPFLDRSGPEWKKQWEAICEENYHDVLRLLESTEFACFRDTLEPIRSIVDSGDIIGELQRLLKLIRMDAESPGVKAWEQARRQRDFLIVLFHFLFEFRSEHYGMLEIGKHLIKRNGLWAMKVYPEEFKSSGVFTEKEFVLELPADVSRWIGIYLEKYRPQLLSPDSKYFFLASKNCNQDRRSTVYLPGKAISKIFKRNTIWFSSSETGFASHACRKLISTVIFKHKIQDEAAKATAAMGGHTVEVSRKHYLCSSEMQVSFMLVITIFQAAGILEPPKVDNPDGNRDPMETIRQLTAVVVRLTSEKQALSDELSTVFQASPKAS